VELIVRDGEKEITRKRLPYARPGEMVSVSLPQSAYDVVQQADEITVEIL